MLVQFWYNWCGWCYLKLQKKSRGLQTPLYIQLPPYFRLMEWDLILFKNKLMFSYENTSYSYWCKKYSR